MIGTLRFVRWAALGLIVLLAIGVAVLELRPGGEPVAEDASAGTVSVPAGVSIGGPFHLVDDKGHTVTDADYRGRWMLVFFGYTNCPDECPLTLQKMAAALGKLGPLADKVAPLFVTVDPARDTPARLASYLENFDARIVGLTGTDEQIASAAKAYSCLLLAGRARKVGRRHRRPFNLPVSHGPGRQVRRAAGVGCRCRETVCYPASEADCKTLSAEHPFTGSDI